MSRWLPVISAAIIPGSGHVILGRPMRGLVFLFWMVIAGYITYHLTMETTSLIGRLSGGLAVWVISILEVSKISRSRK
jgi:hypothetical protein